ncbi:hypothetical protein Trydic_g11113 [Trypoxylus dichotomus]
MEKGVAQGSIRSPLVFLLFIKDIIDYLANYDIILYTDDIGGIVLNPNIVLLYMIHGPLYHDGPAGTERSQNACALVVLGLPADFLFSVDPAARRLRIHSKIVFGYDTDTFASRAKCLRNILIICFNNEVPMFTGPTHHFPFLLPLQLAQYRSKLHTTQRRHLKQET